jgi:hypothetical protein
MNDMIDDEHTPFDGEVPTLGVPSREDGEISESEDEVDADDIRNARTVITTDLDNREPPRAAPARLTFSLPDARGNLDPEEDPKPRATRPLDIYEQFLGTADPPATSDMGNEAGQAAADLLRISLGLTEEGSALHGPIKLALGFHDVWLKQNQKSIATKGSASADARVTDALLRRLDSASISDGDDEDNDTPEMTAKKYIIRRHKTCRLIEEKKLDSEVKDSVTAPAEPLPSNRRLSNHHDFLAMQIFLVDLENMVVLKVWSSPIEMWMFHQFEKGLKAHTALTVFLKSDQGLQLDADIKCYFRIFHHFRETLLRVFFTKPRDPIAVFEKNLKRIKLTLSGVDGSTTPTTLEFFCNTLRFLFN